jgi:hypothetical protein
MQPMLKKPVTRGYDYNYFWKKYKFNSEKILKQYFFPSTAIKVLLFIEQLLKKMKNYINRLKAK